MTQTEFYTKHPTAGNEYRLVYYKNGKKYCERSFNSHILAVTAGQNWCMLDNSYSYEIVKN